MNDKKESDRDCNDYLTDDIMKKRSADTDIDTLFRKSKKPKALQTKE